MFSKRNYSMMKKITCCLILVIIMLPAILSQSPNTLTTQEEKQGWVLLFDGNSSKGWTTTNGSPMTGWDISNGCLSTKKGQTGGDIITVNQYSDFELSVDFRIESGANSGVKYFFYNYEPGGKLGMEFQIIDDNLGEDAVQPNHRCGAFYDVFPPDESKKKMKPAGEWNNLHIISQGKKIEHWLNGVKILEFIRGDKDFTTAVAKSKFSKTIPPFGTVDKGNILLQEHGGVVSFRNIKIRIISNS